MLNATQKTFATTPALLGKTIRSAKAVLVVVEVAVVAKVEEKAARALPKIVVMLAKVAVVGAKAVTAVPLRNASFAISLPTLEKNA